MSKLRLVTVIAGIICFIGIMTSISNGGNTGTWIFITIVAAVILRFLRYIYMK